MFRYNAARTGHPVQPRIAITPANAFALHEIADTDDIVFRVRLKGTGGEAITWSAASDNPKAVVSPTGGTFVGESFFTITVDSGNLSPGKNVLGNVTVTGTANSLNLVNSPTSIPVSVHVVDQIFSSFLPIIEGN
ncbi:MAG: hypothetical protein IAF02_27070 [Anaerolineae bacterium]|nr:hypothetical protein [Anaerolineae bacterium]